ncbi:hypothetical protein BG015_000128, partial [Linnemannia schmuckeri]
MTATTISGTGTIRGPLDLSRLEVSSDSYIHNDDDHSSKQSSIKGPDHGRIGDIHITSTSTRSTVDQERGRPQQQKQQQQQQPRNDLLNPPRFVIRRPSFSGISKASGATSPSPSLTSSVLSDESGVHSSLQHHAQSIQQLQQQQQQHQSSQQQRSGPSSKASMESSHQQQPKQPQLQPQQQRQQEKRPSSTASAPETATRPSSITLPTAARAQEAPASFTLGATSTPNGSVKAAQTTKSINRGGSSSSSPPVANSAHLRQAQSKQVLDSLQESQSPNLRTRLSRLFRQSPKSERSSSLEPRHRVQQKQLTQEIARTMPRLKQQQEQQPP